MKAHRGHAPKGQPPNLAYQQQSAGGLRMERKRLLATPAVVEATEEQDGAEVFGKAALAAAAVFTAAGARATFCSTRVYRGLRSAGRAFWK